MALRRLLVPYLSVVCLAAASCTRPADGLGEESTVRVVFAGDVMLGRGVAPIAAGDPEGLFREVRHVLQDGDLALANLESPLTTRPHSSPNPFALEADPSTASLLAQAGFDLLSLANNHGGDAGPESIVDTVRAVTSAGMSPVGAGSDREEAARPLQIEVGGVTIGILAFDASGGGLSAADGPGVARWDRDTAEVAVRTLASDVDVVVVSIHGGVEYLPESDLRISRIAEMLVGWGADVVWGHGPHVMQPVRLVGSDRPALVATSLGNFLFDQRGSATGQGLVLEVIVGRRGVVAYRTGMTSHHDLRVHFTGWDIPEGDAALLGGEWWSLATALDLEPEWSAPVSFPWGDVVDADSGDVTGAGEANLVVSFRHVSGPHPVRDGFPDVDWTDESGRTAHLGIYGPELSPIWVAGMVPAPIADVAVCDGSVAVAYSTLDDPSTVGTGAAVWRQFGLDASPRLPGSGIPGCVDVDGDGIADPVIDRR